MSDMVSFSRRSSRIRSARPASSKNGCGCIGIRDGTRTALVKKLQRLVKQRPPGLASLWNPYTPTTRSTWKPNGAERHILAISWIRPRLCASGETSRGKDHVGCNPGLFRRAAPVRTGCLVPGQGPDRDAAALAAVGNEGERPGHLPRRLCAAPHSTIKTKTIKIRQGDRTDVRPGHDRADLCVIRDPHSLHLCLRPDVRKP